jgi:hypothetical protein
MVLCCHYDTKTSLDYLWTGSQPMEHISDETKEAMTAVVKAKLAEGESMSLIKEDYKDGFAPTATAIVRALVDYISSKSKG